MHQNMRKWWTLVKSNIVLIGPSGVGKTTVGDYISEKLNLDFFDTDTLIKNNEDKSIEEIFKYKGESYFRKLEEKIVRSLSKKKNIVIATGGGVVLNPINMELLSKSGRLFLLYGSANWIVKNIKSSGITRPLIEEHYSVEEGVRQLLEDRRDIYFKCSDYIVYVDNKSIKDISNEIIHLLWVNYRYVRNRLWNYW